MISRYDTPAQASFMQTYAPVPFDELMQAGAVQQNRWEDSEATGMEMETQLGNIPVLTHVTTSTGETLEVGNAKAVEAEVEKLRNSLDDIARRFPDQASVEHRSALKGLVMDFRRAQSSTGVFGRSKADVENYKAFEEDRKKAEIGSKFHRAIYSDQQLRQFAAGSQEGYTPFTGGVPILGDVDVSKKLTDVLGKMGDVIKAMPGVSQDAAEWQTDLIRKTGYTTGVSAERAATVARRLMEEDPELNADLTAQAEFNGVDPDEWKDQIAATMGETFRSDKVSASWQNHAMAIARKQKTLDDGEVFATSLVMPVTGRTYSSVAEITQSANDRTNAMVAGRESAIDNLMNVWGVPQEAIAVDPVTGEIVVSAAGQTNYDTGEPIDEIQVGTVVARANASVRQHKKAVDDMKRLRKNALLDAGVTEEQFNEDKKKTEVLVDRLMQNTFHRRKALEKYDTEEAAREGLAIESMANIDTKYKDIFKQVNKTLKESTELQSAEVRAVNTPKPFRERLQKQITDYGVTGVSVEWSDMDKGTSEMTPKEKEKYIKPFNETGGVRTGAMATGDVFMDPTDGIMKSLYIVYDDKGNRVGMAKTHLPEGSEGYLYEAGLFDEFNTSIETNLYNQVNGIFQKGGPQSGVLELTEGFRPKIIKRNADGSIDVAIQVEEKDGTIVEEGIPYQSAGAMVNDLNRLYKISAIEEQKTKEAARIKAQDLENSN